jgi:chemotaxis protein CheD
MTYSSSVGRRYTNWRAGEVAKGAGNGIATQHYFDQHFQKDAISLLPGEYYATDRDVVLATVLGSCVAACIRDRESGVGGMNHFMYPASTEACKPADLTRYGEHAMQKLLATIADLGGKRERLEAKVFGGGKVLASVDRVGVGARNAAWALRFLEAQKIQVIAQDLAGNCPRNLCYLPRTGQAFVRKIMTSVSDKGAASSALSRNERA